MEKNSGLYDKHIKIINEESRAMLQIVVTLMIVIDDTS
jgi:hypothetical protein